MKGEQIYKAYTADDLFADVNINVFSSEKVYGLQSTQQ